MKKIVFTHKIYDKDLSMVAMMNKKTRKGNLVINIFFELIIKKDKFPTPSKIIYC